MFLLISKLNIFDLQYVNSTIWIAIKETGSDLSWMNSMLDRGEPVFKDNSGSSEMEERCYLLDIRNETVASHEAKSRGLGSGLNPVKVLRRPCVGDRATDMVLCMRSNFVYPRLS